MRCASSANTSLRNLAARPLVYAELGPEPVKTRYIIENLLNCDVRIERYIAVDINPASQTHMRPVLKDILPDTPIDFAVTSFGQFRLDQFLDKQNAPTLITMLGFQEGNDDPHIYVGLAFPDCARGGSVVVRSPAFKRAQCGANFRIYAHPLMQRFSRIAFEQFIGQKPPSLNRFFLLPVTLIDNSIIYTAILCEEFIDTNRDRYLFVSNFCLKPNRQQYQYYRQRGGFSQSFGKIPPMMKPSCFSFPDAGRVY